MTESKHPEIDTSHLFSAAESGDVGTIETLLAQCPEIIDATNLEGLTALLIAALNGHADIVRALHTAGANMNATNANRSTALHLAVYKGHTNVVIVLLEKHPEIINATTSEGSTALHIAAQSGQAHVVKMLDAAGANINATTSQGSTAMHIAAQNGYAHVVNLLLEKHSEIINATNANGATALHIAALNGHADILSLLIHHNADVTIITHINKTAWDCFVALRQTLIPFSVLAFSKCQNLPNAAKFSALLNAMDPVMQVQGNLLYKIIEILHHNFFKHNGAMNFQKSMNELISTSQDAINTLAPGASIDLLSLISNEIYKLIIHPCIIPELSIPQNIVSPRYAVDFNAVKKYIMGEDLSQNNVPPLAVIAMRFLKSLPNASEIIHEFYTSQKVDANDAPTESYIHEIDETEATKDTEVTGESSSDTFE